MEKLSSRISEDLQSTLVALSGSLKGIECGTRIRIPTVAGYVSYFKSLENSETLSLWLKHELTQEMIDEYCPDKEVDLEDKYD